MATKTSRWRWVDWLARLEASPLTDAEKETGRRFRKACGKRKGMIAAYEVDGAWDHGNTVLSELHAICRQDLMLWCGNAYFRPMLGSPLPAPRSISLGRDELRLLGWMMRNGGRWLYRINRHGYIDKTTDTAKWQLRKGFATQAELNKGDRLYPWRNPPEEAVDNLGKAGLLESNGCGHGWPYQWTSEFRVATHRLYAVANLPKRLRDLVTE